jgi:hypothetical protein
MSMDVLILVSLLVALVLFDLAALRWGADSRRGLDPRYPVRRNL